MNKTTNNHNQTEVQSSSETAFSDPSSFESIVSLNYTEEDVLLIAESLDIDPDVALQRAHLASEGLQDYLQQACYEMLTHEIRD